MFTLDSMRLRAATFSLALTLLGLIAPNANAQNTGAVAPNNQSGIGPSSPNASASSGASATPPTGFVVVQTTYLEQLLAAQKASLDAVAMTAQSAINTSMANLTSVASVTQNSIKASEEREATLIHFVEGVGAIFTVCAAIFGFLGFKKFRQVQGWVKKIEEKERKVDAQASDFENKLGELEKLFTGMHSQSMTLAAVRKSKQRKRDAQTELDEIKPLYEIAVKHQNNRVKSYLAANLSLICMYAERWDEACSYAETAMESNPKKWDDRIYNSACVYATKFGKKQVDADRVKAVELLEAYFKKIPEESLAVEIEKALEDEDLTPIKSEIKKMAQMLSKAYDVACRYALNFAEKNDSAHKDIAIELLCLHFKRNAGTILPAEIQAAIIETKLASVKTDIEALNSDHSKI